MEKGSILAAFMVPHPPMIVPEIGRGSEKQIAETTAAYVRVAEEIARLAPDTIIITSPHIVMYTDYFHIPPGAEAYGSFLEFRAPGVRFSEMYDTEIRDILCRLAKERDFPAGTLGERDRALDHGTMVPLWFIRGKYDGGKILRIGLSGLPLSDHYALGMMIREAVEESGKRAVIVASGDLSHKLQEYGPYGFAPEGPQYDSRIMDVCGRASFGELFDFDETFCDRAAECGHRSFVIIAGAFDGTAVRSEVFSHQDVTGVGYGICSFYPEGPDGERHFLDRYLAGQEAEGAARRKEADPWVRLAYETIDSRILRGRMPDLPDDLPEEMLNTRAGTFVSIHKDGRLRGCIGTFLPTAENVAREIMGNAVSAALRDPRFDPVRADELPRLEISVDVLGTPEPVSSEAELDVKKYGVIVSSGGKRGLLLPDLDGVDTVEEQIRIASAKAGIREGEKIKLQRFEVVRHR